MSELQVKCSFPGRVTGSAATARNAAWPSRPGPTGMLPDPGRVRTVALALRLNLSRAASGLPSAIISDTTATLELEQLPVPPRLPATPSRSHSVKVTTSRLELELNVQVEGEKLSLTARVFLRWPA